MLTRSEQLWLYGWWQWKTQMKNPQSRSRSIRADGYSQVVVPHRFCVESP
ncbi:MAG: hypothetical protein II307_04435 [Alistipes sp.]|nr:hypothetical protein [Alistipes sp.]